MKKVLFVCLPALMAVLALSSNGAMAGDDKVFQGAACQALVGSEESRLNHNVDWLSNNQGETWVTCPLTRDIVYNNTPPEARIRVYRPNQNSPLDCQFVVRRVNGTSWIDSGSAPVGWSYVNLTPNGNSSGASYAVRCRLPANGRIQKIVLKEFD